MLVGIDSALENHKYCVKSEDSKIITRGIVYNTNNSVNKFISKLHEIENKHEKVIIGIEPTNTYHINLTKHLKEDFEVIVINPLRTAKYNKIDNDGIKTDPIDAEGIADFLIDGRHKKVMPFNQKYPLLKELCRSWTILKKDQTRIAARIHSRLVIVNPEFSSYFCDPLSPSGIYILENFETPEELAIVDVEKLQTKLNKVAGHFGKKDKARKIVELAKDSFGMKEDVEGYVRYIQSQLHMYKSYDVEIRTIKKMIREECKKDYCKHEIDLMSSVKGVSRELAAGILSELGDVNNFAKRSSVWRFAGLITTSKESGNMSRKKKLTKKGSKYLRKYLYNSIMTAKLHTKTFAAWYANKMLKVREIDKQQKKEYRAKYKGALSRRMLDTLFLCLKYDRMFDDDIAFENLELMDEVRELIRIQNKKN